VENSAVNGVVAGLPAGTPNLLAHKVNGQIPGAGVCINGSLGNLPQEPDTFNNQCFYWSPNSSYHHVRIRGTPGTNYNLEFYRFVGSNWVKVAQKITGSTNEYLKTFQPGGFFYMYLVRPVSGTGTYDSWVINAGMRAQP